MEITQTVYETVPSGQYLAKVVDVQAEEGNWGQYLRIVFELQDGQQAGVNVTGVASARFSSRSKLYKWAKAIFGKPIPKSYNLKTQDLLDRPCILSLDVIEDDGSEFNRVEAVFPVKREPAKATQAPAPEPVAVADEAPWPDAPPPGLEEETEIPF